MCPNLATASISTAEHGVPLPSRIKLSRTGLLLLPFLLSRGIRRGCLLIPQSFFRYIGIALSLDLQSHSAGEIHIVPVCSETFAKPSLLIRPDCMKNNQTTGNGMHAFTGKARGIKRASIHIRAIQAKIAHMRLRVKLVA